MKQFARNVTIGTLLLIFPIVAAAEDRMCRAGYPQTLSRFARPGYGPHYFTYYVGGGTSEWRGEPRRHDEGTFGVDYSPIVPGFQSGAMLFWSHGRLKQGGTGQYEPNERVSPLANRSH